MKVLFRVEHIGLENIPRKGALIVVANHVTYLDPFWIALPLNRTVRYMAMAPLFRYALMDRVLRWFGAFPVSLHSPDSNAYRTALSILTRGEALMIFPEGGRSPEGKLTPFKGGAASLALRTGATIQPAVVLGGSRVWCPSMRLPRPRKVRVRFLEPILQAAFERTPEDLTRQIRRVIQTGLQHD
jgi:1-acyl-sn-glycerol-3-phosphate acyltransferase